MHPTKHETILSEKSPSFWHNRFVFGRIPIYLGYLVKLIFMLTPSSWLTILTDKRVRLRSGLQFRLGTYTDLVVLKEVLWDNCYEKELVHIDNLDRVIVDVGAGFGDFAISVAERFPNTKVYAFEPDHGYFKLLVANISLNKISNVEPINLAISKASQLPRNIDFLKIDCEGCEFQFINRLKSSRFKKIKAISMEYHESGKNVVSRLVGVLQLNGFAIKYTPKDIPGLGLLWARRV